MKDLWITTSGDLVSFLEKEIAAGRNPSNPTQWAEFMERFAESGGAEKIGEAPDSMSAGYIAGSLRDENIDARVLKIDGRKNA